jgi:hypothetical protein
MEINGDRSAQGMLRVKSRLGSHFASSCALHYSAGKGRSDAEEGRKRYHCRSLELSRKDKSIMDAAECITKVLDVHVTPRP